MPHRSNFNHILRRLNGQIAALFPALDERIKELNTTREYVIDSFPAAICHNMRINRSKLLKDEAYRGYNASERE